VAHEHERGEFAAETMVSAGELARLKADEKKLTICN